MVAAAAAAQTQGRQGPSLPLRPSSTTTVGMEMGLGRKVWGQGVGVGLGLGVDMRGHVWANTMQPILCIQRTSRLLMNMYINQAIKSAL